MKKYKTNQELINYLISKNVIINDVKSALKNIQKYTYYSIVNGYKSVFKDEKNNCKSDVSADLPAVFGGARGGDAAERHRPDRRERPHHGPPCGAQGAGGGK